MLAFFLIPGNAFSFWIRHALRWPPGLPILPRESKVNLFSSKAFPPRIEYANAYIAQTGNPEVTFEIGDFLKAKDGGYDLITMFYPFVTRDYLLTWGLPLRFFKPMGLPAKAAAMTRPGGWMLVFTHTLKEHKSFLELGGSEGGYELVREGRAVSDLVDFHKDVSDRRYSVWRRRAAP